jgi:bifunctional DNA-binding transcriptional regulator/antitoxin component of YhaV-PrlF toxin-antitoxin module
MLNLMSSNESHFLAVQGRGLITLPADVRRRHRLDEPGAQIELREREDGVIELIPHAAVPVDQRWFWTKEWQKMEREADKDIAAGRVTTYDSADEFIDAMKKLT